MTMKSIIGLLELVLEVTGIILLWNSNLWWSIGMVIVVLYRVAVVSYQSGYEKNNWFE